MSAEKGLQEEKNKAAQRELDLIADMYKEGLVKESSILDRTFGSITTGGIVTSAIVKDDAMARRELIARTAQEVASIRGDTIEGTEMLKLGGLSHMVVGDVEDPMSQKTQAAYRKYLEGVIAERRQSAETAPAQKESTHFRDMVESSKAHTIER